MCDAVTVYICSCMGSNGTLGKNFEEINQNEYRERERVRGKKEHLTWIIRRCLY